MRRPTVLFLLAILAAHSPAPAAPARPVHATRAADVDTVRRLDINELTLFVANDGILGFQRGPSDGGLFFPRGASSSVLFASGLWLGARVSGDLRVTAAHYTSEYSPGAMPGGIADDPAKPEYRVWKVSRWTGNPADTAHVERTTAELQADPTLDPLLHHGWSEYLANAAPHGAPVRTWALPAPSGGTVVVDGPDVAGDALLWSVFNDADASRHTQQPGSTPPLGVEVRQSVFGYAGTGPAGQMAFVRWRIVNRGAQVLDSLVVAMWLDPDLGGFTDDFVGCDTTRSLGFAYNAAASDQFYLWQPPAFGVDLLTESFDATRGRSLGMDAYAGFNKGRDPTTAADAWALMSGAPWEFRPSEAGPFDLTGDPVTNSGDLDRFPSDRRMLVARQHGTLLPGDSVDVTLVLVVGQGANRLDSVTQLWCVDNQAQAIHDLGFPYPAPAPVACPTGAVDCPRIPDWYAAQCPSGGELRTGQLDSLAATLDQQSLTFDWGPAPARDSMCAVFGDTRDARTQAKREFAALLANTTGASVLLLPSGSAAIRLDPMTPVSCTALPARTVGDLVAPAPTARVLAADYWNEDLTHRRALAGVNWGGEGFGGGAGFGFSFFGGTLDPNVVSADSFATVQLRFDGTQRAYRFLRLERASDGSAPPQGRGYLYGGYVPVPFQCWDVSDGVPFEAAFIERCFTADDGTILLPAFQPATFDSAWAPSTAPDGGREYLFALRREYAGVAKPEIGYDGSIANDSQPLLYALWAQLRSDFDSIDPQDRFEFSYQLPPSPGADARLWALDSLSLADPHVLAEYESIRDCLAAVNRGDWLHDPCDAAQPQPPALVSVAAEPQRVRLTWQMPAGEREWLQRLAPDPGFWTPVATIDVGASGQVSYEDLDVLPGERYGYRMGPSAFSSPPYIETFVDVPLPSALALSTMFPNPGGTQRSVRFMLRNHERATLEILDIAGRSHVKRDVTSLGPGTHVLTITDRLPPGIYLLRLRQGGDDANSKAVVIR